MKPGQKVNVVFVDSVADCPSLLCEELDLETSDQRRMRRSGEGEEEVFNHRENEEPGEKAERKEKEEEEKGKERKVSKMELTEGEEEQVKPESRLEVEEEQEVQMEDEFENNKETIADKQPSNEEKDEQKKSRKRRGKKQNERVKSRRAVKISYRVEEEKHNQIQDVSTISSEESSTLSEPPFGLMNSSDLPDPIYLGDGGTGMYCPPIPVPLLYSQPPIQIQPAPPHPQGTKRPHSPLLPHNLPQQGSQPLEVRVHFVAVYHSLGCLMICEHKVNHTEPKLVPSNFLTHTSPFYFPLKK